MSAPRASRGIGGAWDALAPWWKETFTDGADVEYARQIVPIIAEELKSARRVLDLGCGEGQITRLLSGGGARAIGVDPSDAQLRNALVASADDAHRPCYARAMGERLPFGDRSFDAIVCCLAIEHAGNVDLVLAEAERVLDDGGCFLLLVNHPMYQGEGSGFVDDAILGERYWHVGPYLDEAVSVEEVDRRVFIPFAHRPLSRYVNPLAERDCLLTRLLEPPPLPEFLENSLAPELEGAIPRLLVMRFERRPAPARAKKPKGVRGR